MGNCCGKNLVDRCTLRFLEETRRLKEFPQSFGELRRVIVESFPALDGERYILMAGSYEVTGDKVYADIKKFKQVILDIKFPQQQPLHPLAPSPQNNIQNSTHLFFIQHKQTKHKAFLTNMGLALTTSEAI